METLIHILAILGAATLLISALVILALLIEFRKWRRERADPLMPPSDGDELAAALRGDSDRDYDDNALHAPRTTLPTKARDREFQEPHDDARFTNNLPLDTIPADIPSAWISPDTVRGIYPPAIIALCNRWLSRISDLHDEDVPNPDEVAAFELGVGVGLLRIWTLTMLAAPLLRVTQARGVEYDALNRELGTENRQTELP